MSLDSQAFFQPGGRSKIEARVLNSALFLFMEKGYFNTSIPDLVQHSVVSTGSIYKYFGDKEGLAKKLMDELIKDLYEQEKTLIAQYDSCFARYQALVTWMVNFTLEYPAVMSFVLYAKHQAFLPNSSSVCSSKPFMLLRDVIADGMAHGEVRDMDVMVAAALAFGGVLRMMQLSLDGVLPESLDYYQDELINAGWRAIESSK